MAALISIALLLCTERRVDRRGECCVRVTDFSLEGRMPQRCTFAQQLADGSWDWQSRMFRPQSGCSLELLDLDLMRRCVADRTLTFLGDSAMRDLAMSMASLLAGVRIIDAEDRSLGQPNWRPDVWESVHPARKGIMHALLNESARSKKTDGSRGSYTDPTHRWTIRAYHDLPRAVHWPAIERIVRAPLTEEGVSFVQLGIHDTNPRISELGNASLGWRLDPLNSFTHGPVFQPFLDHWCEIEQHQQRQLGPASTALPPYEQRTKVTKHRTGSRRDASIRRMLPATPPSPLVWMTANEQCRAKKPRKWRYQAALVHAANRAAAAAAAAVGVPVVDWWGLYTNETERCRTTTDGVCYSPPCLTLRAHIVHTPCARPRPTRPVGGQ